MEDRKFNFEKDNEPLEEKEMSGGIKLKPNRSRFAQRARAKVQFEKAAQQAQQQHEGHLKEGYELGQRFMQALADTTLLENKGPMAKSVEKEIIGNLINWAIKVNNDEREKEGMGSSAVMTIVLNSLFKIRDNYNECQHRCALLEDQLANLSSEVKRPHEKE